MPKKETKKSTQVGLVESDKQHQTRRVTVKFSAPHPKYGKYVERSSVLHVHDEKNESRTGDRVEIVACRPISKTKKFALVRVVERAPVG